VDIKKAKREYAKDQKNPAHNEQVKKLEQEQLELPSRLHQPTLHCEDITSENWQNYLLKMTSRWQV